MEQTESRHSWETDELVRQLDRVIGIGFNWLRSLPPRSEGEIPTVNAAKQLSEEACEFASSISNAIKLNQKVSAYANLRPLVDRWLHAAWFFEKPTDTIDWSYWSLAEINQLANNASSQGAVNPQDREPMRDLMRDIRHWNRSETGEDQQMFKPGRYEWNNIRKQLVDAATPRFKSHYDVASTYVHPTYRGANASDLDTEYVLRQSILITCFTLIVCGATLMPHEDNPAAHQIDPHLLDLLALLNNFFTLPMDIIDAARNPPEGVNSAHILYCFGSMLVRIVFGRDVINHQR